MGADALPDDIEALKSALIEARAGRAASEAWAQSPADFSAVDAKLQACLARHRDTPGVDNCYGVAKAAADRRLNDVYAGLVNALKRPGDPIEVHDDSEILRRLVAAERAWIAFRDAECSYHSSYILHGTGEDGAGCPSEPAMMKRSGRISRSKALKTKRQS